MAAFDYIALDAKGKEHKGVIEGGWLSAGSPDTA